MDFQQRLTALREKFEGQPPQFLAIHRRAIQQLVDSGMQQRVLGVGATLPSFTLSDQRGRPVAS